MDNRVIRRFGKQNFVVFGFFSKILSGFLYALVELTFLLIITFISFTSISEPYEIIKKERDNQEIKYKYYSYLFKRWIAYFALGLPFIYLGLKLSNLEIISINLDINNIYQLILNLLITIAKVQSKFYVLIFIPAILVFILKIYTEKVWYDLNRESIKLFDIRLEEFRDKKSLIKLYEQAKEKRLKEFRKFIISYIKKSPVLFILFGIIFLYIVLTILTIFLNENIKYHIIYLIPLGFVWALFSVFLTVFEGQISRITQSMIEIKHELK